MKIHGEFKCQNITCNLINKWEYHIPNHSNSRLYDAETVDQSKIRPLMVDDYSDRYELSFRCKRCNCPTTVTYTL